MKRVLLTGAAGGIGKHLRRLLPPIYPDLVLSDIVTPEDLEPGEKFIQADVSKPVEIEKVCEGVEGIIHLGGNTGEAWEPILKANIVGCYNLFEAARKQSVKRVIFASSNHAVGFYPRSTKIDTKVIPRPDTRYGLSKLFGEGVGAMYAYKHGIGVTSIRIGNVNEVPIDKRRLSLMISPRDLVKLIRIGLERPDLVYEVVYGVSANTRSWYDNSHAESLGYKPEDNSEANAAAVLTTEQAAAPNDPSEFYQSGTFCGAEYSADFASMKGKS
jgi:uronate dehydrogenase